MSKRDLFIFLFKWKGTIGLTFFSVVALVTLFVYLLPPEYTAVSKVLVEHSKAPSMRAELYAGIEPVQVLNTEIEIALSRTVMERVVDTVRPHERPQRDNAVSQFMARVQDWLSDLGLLDRLERREHWIRSLMKDVKAKPAVNSDVFTIKYGNEDSALAADLVNAMTEAYLAHHQTVYSQETVAVFYRAQMEEAKAELDRLRQRLEEYKTQASLAAMDAEKNRLVLEGGNIREKITALRLELAEVLTKYDPRHSKAALLRTKIHTAEERVAEIKRQLTLIEQADTKALEIETLIHSQEKTFMTTRELYDRAVANALTNPSIVNVRVIDRAVVPARPSFSRLFLIAVSAFAGLVFALAVAMLREYFDHRVLTPDLAERALGIPVLGSVPYSRAVAS